MDGGVGVVAVGTTVGLSGEAVTIRIGEVGAFVPGGPAAGEEEGDEDGGEWAHGGGV